MVKVRARWIELFGVLRGCCREASLERRRWSKVAGDCKLDLD